VAGETCHGVVESEELAQHAKDLEDSLSHMKTTVPAESDGRLRERVSTVELEGRRFEVTTLVPEPPYADLARRRRERSAATAPGGPLRIPGQGAFPAVRDSRFRGAPGDDAARSTRRCRRDRRPGRRQGAGADRRPREGRRGQACGRSRRRRAEG